MGENGTFPSCCCCCVGCIVVAAAVVVDEFDAVAEGLLAVGGIQAVLCISVVTNTSIKVNQFDFGSGKYYRNFCKKKKSSHQCCKEKRRASWQNFCTLVV